MELKGKRIIITGGSCGVGRELVDLLAAENELLVIARPSDRLEELSRTYEKVDTFAFDLADTAKLEELDGQVPKFGNFDVLINNAAMQVSGDFLGDPFDTEILVRELCLNLIAPCLLTRLLAMGRMGKGGVVLNVGSALALVPKESSPIYCASKAGLRSASCSLNYQLEKRGIKVLHAMLPLVETRMCSGRGNGKISARRAASELIKCIEKERRESSVGKARLLEFIYRSAPWLAYRILRNT